MGLTEWAYRLSESLLSEPLPRRWAHSLGVAKRARSLSPILGDDAELLKAAAVLHDIGYSPAIAVTGFHPLDGAVAVRKYLIPGLGAHRLDRLKPEHIEVFYANMQANGSKPGTAHQVHRTFRTALNEAVRRGHLGKNPVQLAKAPKTGEYEVEPYSVQEVQRLLKAADQHRNSAIFGRLFSWRLYIRRALEGKQPSAPSAASGRGWREAGLGP
ncbi:HD domain-containing protein [Streptomyces sp. NPDC005271]|uniref:HD domain-containing protein n=1 Tax=unclassified Streptomyces TaxID=2593676 RepID=UPI0033B419A1